MALLRALQYALGMVLLACHEVDIYIHISDPKAISYAIIMLQSFDP